MASKTINRAFDAIIDGTVAVVNDVRISLLNALLNDLFPECYRCEGKHRFYIADPDNPEYWLGVNETTLPTINASDLL